MNNKFLLISVLLQICLIDNSQITNTQGTVSPSPQNADNGTNSPNSNANNNQGTESATSAPTAPNASGSPSTPSNQADGNSSSSSSTAPTPAAESLCDYDAQSMITRIDPNLKPTEYEMIGKQSFTQEALPCDGISEKTCCTEPTLKKIRKQWQEVTNMNKEQAFAQYMYALDSLFNFNYEKVIDYADKHIVFVRKMKDRRRLDNAEAVLHSFTKVITRSFSINGFTRWKTSAKTCYKHMMQVAKGAFCSPCDQGEHDRITHKKEVESRRTQTTEPEVKKVQKKFVVNLSPSDAFSFTNKCVEHLDRTRKILRFLKHIMVVMKFKSKTHFEELNFPDDLDSVTYARVETKMRKCANSINDCDDDEIVKHFYDINIGTSQERKYYAFVTNIALLVDKEFNQGQFTHTTNSIYRILLLDSNDYWHGKELHQSSRILQAETTTTPVIKSYYVNSSYEPNGIYVDFTKNIYAFSLSDKFLPNKARDQIFEYKIDKKYTKMFSTMDTNMKIVDLKRFSMFQSGLHCPMATSLGGELNQTNLNRVDPKICPMVKTSCCTERSFLNLDIEWVQSKLLLDSKYKATIDMFDFMNGPFQDKKTGYLKVLPNDPGVKGCSGDINHSRCINLYDMIHKSVDHAKMYLTQYKADYARCNSVIESIRLELKCAVCDETASKYFDSKKKNVIIQRDQINQVIIACYDMDLFEVELMREIFLAYLNYAKQVAPELTINHKILFSIFSAEYKACSEWITMSRSTKDSDFTRGRECIKYAYEKLEDVKLRSTDIMLNRDTVTYFKEIFRTLASDEAKERIELLIPEIIKPESMRLYASRDRNLSSGVSYFL